ncbi:OPA3-domain-containing protein [Epithele typhae]|uniref:OPA3-domain-containing protein n=1 Tax=Epithele typhae TaxID=378194 RepID=UPI002007DADC|nr:OPA3-domain-containing protein [Epithele typhae]KAH9914514.1 OPA3-domain-containing protein [Epithele typhae]
MATAKIASLVIRTLAKPISAQLKTQAKQHEMFRQICVGLAQRMYQTEIKMRTNLLGEPAKHVRPLSETKAIDNGANALAEGFLFVVATGLILGETWRSSNKQARRRDDVDDQLDQLKESVEGLNQRVDTLARLQEERMADEAAKHDELARILTRVVEIGLRGGWAEFEGTPLPLPIVDLTRGIRPPLSQPESPSADSPQGSSSSS